MGRVQMKKSAFHKFGKINLKNKSELNPRHC